MKKLDTTNIAWFNPQNSMYKYSTGPAESELSWYMFTTLLRKSLYYARGVDFFLTKYDLL